jgi:outer membrane lipoprotein-sorting protein
LTAVKPSPIVACALLCATASLAQQPLPADVRGADKLAAVLQRVSEVQNGITTLQAGFTQHRVSHLLAAPSDSRGRFYFHVPGEVRWEYQAPRAMTVLISGGVAITYRPAEKRAERVEVGRVQRRVFHFLGAAEPLDALKNYFSFTFRDPGDGANYEIILEPTTHMLRKRVTRVDVKIDRSRFLPVALSYTEPDGDSTSWEFHDIVVNQPLPEDLFRLQLPPDVKVVQIKLHSGE